MTVQDVRQQLALILTEWMAEDGWTVTTATVPKLSSKTVVIRHPSSITPYSLAASSAALRITLYVNEGNDGEAVDELYARLCPGPKSLLHYLLAHPSFQLISDNVSIGNVGPRDEGPTGFLAADLTLPVLVAPPET